MDFPALVPSSRSYTSGDYAVRTFRSQSGAESRILYGDTRFGATLELQYQNVTDKNAQTFVGHYENVKGTFGTFELPLRLIEGWSGNAQLIGTGYRNQRNSIATYIDQDGFIVTAQPFETRFTYETETGHPIGLLLEDEVTNFWRNSTDLTVGSFPQFWPAALTNEVIPPGDGPATKYKYLSSTLFLRQFFDPVRLPGDTYTASIYIYVPKQPNVPGWLVATDYNDTNGKISKIYDIFDQWVKVSITTEVPDTFFVDFNMNITAPLFQGYTFYAWGAQLENNLTASSYIPTSGTAVTRQADKLQTIGSWRYAEPPEITNVRPGVSNARVRLISVV